MTAVMIVPAALGSAAVVLYNALTKQYRAHTPSLLPFSPGQTARRALDHIHLAKAAITSAPAAIHTRDATVHAQASTAHVLTTTLPHPTALPIGNLGGMLPAAKADNRTGSHAVSVTESGGGSTIRGSQPTAWTGETKAGGHSGNNSDFEQIAGTTSTSLALLERQQQQQREKAGHTAAAHAKKRETQQQEQQQAALDAAAKKHQQEDALEAAAAAKAARDRQVFRNALAANAAKERAEREHAFEAAAAKKAAWDRQVFLNALAANAAKQRASSVTSHPVSESTGTIGLPLPVQFLHNGTVDQGVDYIAPAGTPLYAMGSGTIVSIGIFGFGTNTPVLRIDAGPLAGECLFYGHAASTLVPVGAHVVQGQEIATVGALGITNGPRLTIGFYPPGPMASGERMLRLINSLVGYNTGQPAQAPVASTPHAAPQNTQNTEQVQAFEAAAAAHDRQVFHDAQVHAFEAAAAAHDRQVFIAALAAKAPSQTVPTGTPVSTSSGSLGTRQGFAVALLNALGAPVTSQNLLAVESWEIQEGGGFGGLAAFNPLNTTLPMPGSHPVNLVGIQAYTSAAQGLQATVATLLSGRYSGIVGALRAGSSAQAVEQAVAQSPWGTGPFLLRS